MSLKTLGNRICNLNAYDELLHDFTIDMELSTSVQQVLEQHGRLVFVCFGEQFDVIPVLPLVFKYARVHH